MRFEKRFIDGKWYWVAINQDDEIVAQAAADEPISVVPTHITRIRNILSAAEDKVFRDATALTALEQSRLIVLIARMVYQKST